MGGSDGVAPGGEHRWSSGTLRLGRTWRPVWRTRDQRSVTMGVSPVVGDLMGVKPDRADLPTAREGSSRPSPPRVPQGAPGTVTDVSSTRGRPDRLANSPGSP